MGQQVSTGLWWPEKTVCHTTHSCYAAFTPPFKLHTDVCGSGLGAVLCQTCKDATDVVIAYASRRLNKAESHYPTHKLELLVLKWMVVEKFHEYLYGSTFDVYTYNNPLTYMLTTAKLDAASHCWVASLANYNFWLYYQAGKTNIDVDAWLKVSWPGCMPDNSGTHLKVTAVAVWGVQGAALKGAASPNEAYSCNLHMLDMVQDSQQVTCITLEDWCQAQQVDPTLCLVMELWGNGRPNWLIHPNLVSSCGNKITFHSNRVSCTDEPDLGNQRRPFFSMYCQPHRETLLKGMPWWGWSSRPGTHDWPHACPVLLALHGCSGKGTHAKVLPIPCLQS